MADDEVPPAPVPAGRGGGRARIFLMVAGGLAAPSLALAAFFFTNSGSDTPARAAVVQPGVVTGAANAPRPSPSGGAAPATTSTTAAPVAAPSVPPRDPFVPLVTQAPGGTPGH
jgi:hypothetical protein